MKLGLTVLALVIMMAGGSYMFSQESNVKAPSSREAAMVAEPQTFPLWEKGAPGALGDSDADRPTLTYYAPVYSNGTAVVVAPGGGYVFVAMNHEGRQIANWLNALGVSAFVL